MVSSWTDDATIIPVLVLLLAVHTPADVSAADGNAPVGAKIVTCDGCLLNRLPRLRDFINDEVKRYPAVEVEFVPGHNPELKFLSLSRRVLSTHAMTSMTNRAIEELLQSKGLHTWTPRPRYIPAAILATAHCSAWRQTAGCDPDGQREPDDDDSCYRTIAPGRSGYCECLGRDDALFTCDHRPLTCEDICTQKPEADLDVAGVGAGGDVPDDF